MTIVGFWNRNLANRFFIEQGLGIDLAKKARSPRAALERTGQTGEPFYAERGKRVD